MQYLRDIVLTWRKSIVPETLTLKMSDISLLLVGLDHDIFLFLIQIKSIFLISAQ